VSRPSTAYKASRGDWIASLRESPVFCHLTEDQLRGLILDGRLHRFTDGDEIIHAEDPTCSAFLVVEGACEVESATEATFLMAPTLVGEVAVLTGTPRTSTVRAVGHVEAIVIERDRFLAAIRTSAAAGQALTELVADRICAPDSVREVGRFAVEDIIGEGGSGRVLRARHPLLDVPIALKMLSHARALMPEGPREFISEARLLFDLDHPRMVRVLDVFEAHRTFFIVMPWIDGDSLRHRLDDGARLTRDQIFAVAEQTLDALGALHRGGIVHRDIKPSNLLIDSTGKVMLIDFGIACKIESSQSSVRRLVGSPAYCSPEQILSRPVDGRADVYSLGCTLYELVFGLPPFGETEIEAVIEGHLRGTPSWDMADAVPMGDDFMRWLRRCLSRTRATRYDAAAALDALRGIAGAAKTLQLRSETESAE